MGKKRLFNTEKCSAKKTAESSLMTSSVSIGSMLELLCADFYSFRIIIIKVRKYCKSHDQSHRLSSPSKICYLKKQLCNMLSCQRTIAYIYLFTTLTYLSPSAHVNFLLMNTYSPQCIMNLGSKDPIRIYIVNGVCWLTIRSISNSLREWRAAATVICSLNPFYTIFITLFQISRVSFDSEIFLMAKC